MMGKKWLQNVDSAKRSIQSIKAIGPGLKHPVKDNKKGIVADV